MGSKRKTRAAQPAAAPAKALRSVPDVFSEALLAALPPPGTETFRLSVGGNELVVLSVPAYLAAVLEECPAAERAVLVGVLTGMSDAEIADQRGTSPRTIANQARALMRRLGVNSRRELMAQLRGSWSSSA